MADLRISGCVEKFIQTETSFQPNSPEIQVIKRSIHTYTKAGNCCDELKRIFQVIWQAIKFIFCAETQWQKGVKTLATELAFQIKAGVPEELVGQNKGAINKLASLMLNALLSQNQKKETSYKAPEEVVNAKAGLNQKFVDQKKAIEEERRQMKQAETYFGAVRDLLPAHMGNYIRALTKGLSLVGFLNTLKAMENVRAKGDPTALINEMQKMRAKLTKEQLDNKEKFDQLSDEITQEFISKANILMACLVPNVSSTQKSFFSFSKQMPDHLTYVIGEQIYGREEQAANCIQKIGNLSKEEQDEFLKICNTVPLDVVMNPDKALPAGTNLLNAFIDKFNQIIENEDIYASEEEIQEAQKRLANPENPFSIHNQSDSNLGDNELVPREVFPDLFPSQQGSSSSSSSSSTSSSSSSQTVPGDDVMPTEMMNLFFRGLPREVQSRFQAGWSHLNSNKKAAVIGTFRGLREETRKEIENAKAAITTFYAIVATEIDKEDPLSDEASKDISKELDFLSQLLGISSVVVNPEEKQEEPQEDNEEVFI